MRPTPVHLCRTVAACALLTLPLFAGAADKAASSAAEAQYKADLARCNSGQSGEDKKTCRTEMTRAYAEMKKGGFAGADYAKNARQRCDALKGSDRDMCVQRMSGAGSAQGSVSGGGIIRESTMTAPGK